jgi:glycosyltransferase involved in cell wall biosynthesis
LKILVNTRLLLKDRLDGIGWFSYESLKLICEQHPEHQFYFVFDRKYHPSFIFGSNVMPVVMPPQARHPLLFIIWFEFCLPLVIRRIKPDVFLSPDGFVSLLSGVKTVGVIHDLNFEHNPKDLPWLIRIYYRFFFRRFARRCDRIATVSAFSKSDIVKSYNISPEKIDVVYNGANQMFTPVSPEIVRHTRTMFSSGNPYFLFVGSLHPRKNLANLFRAFDMFCQKSDTPYKLLIVGNRKWWTGEIEAAYNSMKYKGNVVFTGRLSSESLHHVIASSFAVTYVSLFEGFGIPILEAFYCDVPVITSNITSMPEIAGNAAILVNPYNPEEISDAMLRLHSDESFRLQLIERGRIRRRDFSWQNTADCLWASILKTISE